METGEKLECLASLVVEELENEIDELIELFSGARHGWSLQNLKRSQSIASRFEMTENCQSLISAEQVTEHAQYLS